MRAIHSSVPFVNIAEAPVVDGIADANDTIGCDKSNVGSVIGE
jgi:hypothetical protein